MVRIGLVGCGTIGSRLALAIDRKYPRAACLVALHDQDQKRARLLQHRLTHHHPRLCSLPTLIQRSQLIIEAASAAAVPGLVHAAIRAKRDVLIMSVGGLLANRTWQRLAQDRTIRVYIPSGAVAGLDGIKAMALGRIHSVSLTTRKPPAALADAPSLARRPRRLTTRRPVTVFEGSAQAVVRAFPQNTNVAAALTLASRMSARRTRVRVVADPRIRMNTHELEVVGDCGRIQCLIESRPSSNPKTSELAVRSALATLDGILNPIHIGT